MTYKDSGADWRLVVRVLARQVVIDRADQRLALAVIGQALADLTHPDAVIRKSTVRSIRQECLAWWCDQLGVEHDFLMQLIFDAELIPSQTEGVISAA